VKLAEVVSLVRAARTRPGEPKPVVVAGARELVPLLARELRAGAAPSAVREGGSPAGAAVLVWVGEADEDALRAASRARVPIVAVTDGRSLPYVLDTNLVDVRPGEPLPVERVARAIAGALGSAGVRLAAGLPVLRRPLADELVRREARIAALASTRGEPAAVLTVLANEQVLLAGRIAEIYGGAASGAARLALPLAGLAARSVGRRLAGRVPTNPVVRALLAYGVVTAAGKAAHLSVRSGS
jgi:hypothetical protein